MLVKQWKEFLSTLPDDAEIIIRLADSECEYNLVSSHLVGRTNILYIDAENREDEY